MSKLLPFDGKHPSLAADAWVADGAKIIGDVQVGGSSSIWFNTVLRGDIQPVRIGHHSNIQDNSVCHVGYQEPCLVGNYVTVGHGVILHGCTIEDLVLVGMGATIMTGVIIGTQSIIGAAALVTEGTQIPPCSLVYGTPARVVSRVGDKERESIRQLAEEYCEWSARYRQGTVNPLS